MKWNFSMLNVSPIFRISIGLLLLTLSLLLVGDLLGIVPNQQESEIASRKVMAESLAIQISSDIGQKHLNEAVSFLNRIVKRNKKIQSLALKTIQHTTVMKSSRHDFYWEEREDGRSTVDYIQVPIYANEGRWGTLEVSFVPMGTLWTNMFTKHSFSSMLLFIMVFGFMTYWLFLRRALSELDPSSVIPDRVRSALDVLKEGLIIIDTKERIVLVNDAFKKQLSLLDSDLIGKRLSHFSWRIEDETQLFTSKMLPWNVLLDTEKISPLKTLKLETLKKEMFTFNVNVSPIKAPNQKLKGVIITLDDITEMEKKNKELSHILKRLEKSKEEIARQNIELVELSTRDPLTNLLNRRALFSNLNTLLFEMHEASTSLSCIMLDIDFFKSVNDTYGHTVGDQVLKSFSEILQANTKQDWLVCRYGGEEFVILLPKITLPRALKIAEKIRIAIESYSFEEIAEGLHVTSSLGVSCTHNKYINDADKLIDYADQALYMAKQTGRNRVTPYTENETIEDVDDIHLETKNRRKASKASTRVNPLPKVEKNIVKKKEKCEYSAYTIILDRLMQAQRLAQRDKKNLVVLSIFIDTIQQVNNALGHSIAAKLKKIAFSRLSDIFRISDSIIPSIDIDKYISLSRVTDSEFVGILSGVQKNSDTTWAIFRMIHVLSEAIEIDGHEIVMTANIGVSSYPDDTENPEILLSNSKMAMLKAIDKGRGEFVFYDKKMNILAKKALQIESQLHMALEREELYLNFQPIVNLKTGMIEKVEALLRWKHPELGLVSPDIFIDIAEHTGNIKIIGKWIIENACRQLSIWQTKGYSTLMMSINLSAVQFYEADIVEDIMGLVEKEGVSPKSIIFELTETALVKQYSDIFETIMLLHQKGFSIALDDFGTGYSSLTYLQKFPIEWVKIDRSLMTHFPHDIHAVSIVSGLLSLCHNIDINVICEGVEEMTQLAMLNDLMCDAVQGYLFSKPLSAREMTAFLETSKIRQIIHKVHNAKNEYKERHNDMTLVDVLNTPHSLS